MNASQLVDCLEGFFLKKKKENGWLHTNPFASSHDIWQISDDDPPALFFRELMLIIEHRVGIG